MAAPCSFVIMLTTPQNRYISVVIIVALAQTIITSTFCPMANTILVTWIYSLKTWPCQWFFTLILNCICEIYCTICLYTNLSNISYTVHYITLFTTIKLRIPPHRCSDIVFVKATYKSLVIKHCEQSISYTADMQKFCQQQILGAHLFALSKGYFL